MVVVQVLVAAFLMWWAVVSISKLVLIRSLDQITGNKAMWFGLFAFALIAASLAVMGYGSIY